MKKNSIYPFSGALLLFFALVLMLSWYMRFAADDYFYIWDIQEHGMLANLKAQYFGWCGRFSSLILLEILYGNFGMHQSYYFLFPLISFLLIAIGAYKNINVFISYYPVEIHIAEKYILSLSFTALLFFLSVDIGESWFWYCGLSSYLYSVIAFTWGVYFVFSKQRNFLMYAGTIVSFIYVGGASEVFTMIFGCSFIFILIHNFRKAGSLSSFMQQDLNKKFVVAMVFLGIAFLVFLIAPGNYVRNQLFPKRQFFYSFFIAAKAIVKFFVFYLPFKLHYILAFSIPFVFIGKRFQSVKEHKFQWPFPLFFKRATLMFAALAFLFFYLVAFIMVETGSPRIWFMISFLLSVYCSCIAFYAGYNHHHVVSEKQFSILKNCSICLGLLITGYSLIHQYRVAGNYAAAFDARVNHLQHLNNEPGVAASVVSLAPLPECGMLYSAEITANTNHFKNQHLRLGYHLKYKVVVKK
jgi:hypothetical protein